jgi:hypothetical protein
MATTLQIPLHDYLGTIYRPDREYVDGEIRERNVGKYEHARIQALLARWFGNHEQEWGAQVVTEQRVRVSPTRIRIPDVTLLPLNTQPDVIVDPPLLIIEILSPDDTYSDTQERAQWVSKPSGSSIRRRALAARAQARSGSNLRVWKRRGLRCTSTCPIYSVS